MSELKLEVGKRYETHDVGIIHGWQPIETAPTNERVLFTDGKEIWISTKYVVDDVVGLKLADHPTHWMPLPEPPKMDIKQ